MNHRSRLEKLERARSRYEKDPAIVRKMLEEKLTAIRERLSPFVEPTPEEVAQTVRKLREFFPLGPRGRGADQRR
jgi:hypothetical protein